MHFLSVIWNKAGNQSNVKGLQVVCWTVGFDMLEECSSLSSDASVIRRLTFAARFIDRDAPGYWNFVRQFGFKFSAEKPDSRKVQTLLENLALLEEESFAKDSELLTELHQFTGYNGKPLGIVLISKNKKCLKCGGKLLVRGDRPSFPVVYNDDLGTVSGTHFRKYCENQSKGCHFVQHYGFYTNENNGGVIYNDDYYELPFFMSTNMTAFQMKMLHCFTAEILVGQLSYKQKAEIYNICHGYDSHLKKSIPCRQPILAEDT